jgi:predicted dehydrogenase
MIAPDLESKSPNDLRRPRVGFLGTGRIGLRRMRALIDSGLIDTIAIADPSPAMAAEASALAPEAEIVASLDALLEHNLDGLVIATPSALHAEQAIRTLERGVAVFCQKPLGRTADEVAAVVAAARRSNRLLAVDLSYRFTSGMQRIRELIAAGELGSVFAADLVFHNAYGPDKPWFFDRTLSGGGCVIDLGVHLVDLALWALDFPEVRSISSHLRCNGAPVPEDGSGVEDFAIATIELETGTVLRLACSWHLHAGRDAVIGASFYGTGGGAALENVAGSFLDFAAEHRSGTTSTMIAEPPDDWPGRATLRWAARLSMRSDFDPEAERLVDVARVLDGIYGR